MQRTFVVEKLVKDTQMFVNSNDPSQHLSTHQRKMKKMRIKRLKYDMKS